MKPAEYWARRSESVLLEGERRGEELIHEYIDFYSTTSRQLQRDIDAFYGKYAAENGITLQEAQKRLTASEVKSFREAIRRCRGPARYHHSQHR